MIIIRWLFFIGLVSWPFLQAYLILFPRKWLIKDAQIAAFHQKSMHALPKWRLLNKYGKIYMALWYSSCVFVLVGMFIMWWFGETRFFPWK